jgi:hypothetical protein
MNGPVRTYDLAVPDGGRMDGDPRPLCTGPRPHRLGSKGLETLGYNMIWVVIGTEKVRCRHN